MRFDWYLLQSISILQGIFMLLIIDYLARDEQLEIYDENYQERGSEEATNSFRISDLIAES